MSGRRSPLSSIAAVLAAVGLAACGATARVGRDGVLEIGLSEYRVTPQRVAAAPGVLTIFVHNYGRLTHDLVISEDGTVIASTAPVAPGETAELDAALTAGSYLMASTILSDQALGAYGTLVVR
ncbi:MAG: hypothetical protein ABSH51_03705 [Solirubrobacteraceae bacterium]